QVNVLSTTDTSPIVAVTSSLYCALLSTADRSSTSDAGSSTVLPVFVPVTVYTIVSPALTAVPDAGSAVLLTSKPLSTTGCVVWAGGGVIGVPGFVGLAGSVGSSGICGVASPVATFCSSALCTPASTVTV